MTQYEIRAYFHTKENVLVQVAGHGDGSPEMAWGDTFFFVRDQNGEPRKMPFTTIVTKDYDGFDTASQLNRGGLYRLNMEVGGERFAELFGFMPKEFQHQLDVFDFTAMNQLFPHPLYGTYGWVSIINPAGESTDMITALLGFALERALHRVGS